MDVVWGIVGTLVYVVAVFIAVEFCCGRIKKYSSAKREEEEEGSGRRESATAAATDDVPGATAAETSAEAEAVVEKPSSDEERIRTGAAEASDASAEVPPEPEVTVDIHKEPPMPEKAIPDIIPEPENIPEPEKIPEPVNTPEPVNIPVDVHVKEEEETLETVPKEPKVQEVIEPEVEEIKPEVEEMKPEVKEVEPEVEEVKPEVEKAVEPEVEEFEPEEEDEGDAAVAATKIQAGFRGHQSRKRVKKLKEEKDAATKIQAGFRGWKSRKQVSVKRRGAPGVEVETDEHLTEEPPAAVTEEDTSLAMPSDVIEQHVAKETASSIEPPSTFTVDTSPVEEAAPEVPSPVVESTPTELFAKQPDITPPASPEVTQPKIAETPSPTEAESPETSSPEEISPAPFSKPIPPTPPPTPADVDLLGGTEATEPASGTDPVLEGGDFVVGDVEPAMAKAVAEKLDVLEKETVEASEKVLYQPGTEVSFVVAPPPLQPVSMETVAMEETDSSPESAEQSPVTVVEAKTLIKQESEVYPYVEETQTSEEFDPESLIAQAVSSKSSSAAPEVVVTSERTVTMETGPDGKTTQTVVKVEHTVVKEITTVVTPKTTEVVTTEERTATSVSSDDRSSEEQVTVVEASDDDTFEESGLEQQQGELMMRSSGPKDKGAQLDRTGASFTDKWEPEPGES